MGIVILDKKLREEIDKETEEKMQKIDWVDDGLGNLIPELYFEEEK